MAARKQIRRRMRRARPQVRRAPSSSAANIRMDAKQSLSVEGGLMIGGVHDPAEKAADRMADRVMRMPSSAPVVHRKCAACEGEGKKVQRAPKDPDKEDIVQTKAAPKAAPAALGTGAVAASPGAARAIRSMGTGKPMAKAERAFFEPRLGADLSSVRIHDGPAADKASRAVNARAFTLGQDIAFARGEQQPGTQTGRHLMAHELAHVIQEAGGLRRAEETCGDCRDDWETTVDADHARSLTMLDNTIAKIASYNGSTPVDVKNALETRFDASSNGFATWINFNLRFLRLMAPLAGYQCQLSTCGLCNTPNRYGWSAWCIPFTDIRVCDPKYFSMNSRRRSMGLVHEWVHKYGCNFDFGYCSGSDCPGGTTRSLFNADPWAKLVLDLG